MDGRMKKRQQHITAFYMEMLVLIAVFMVVILVLTQVFALSRRQSTQARVLTNAVCLAENTAQLVAASDSWETFVALLGEGWRIPTRNDADRMIRCAYYDDVGEKPLQESTGNYYVEVEWIPAGEDAAGLMEGCIAVYWRGGAEPVYTLETAVCLGGETDR